ncbi:Long chain acyl-CoA synthetase 7 (peroxisomal) [Citrus sinensis]|uniref:Long chain acyl-CoA synthetase 7 (Peroxisomal) n=1 Tax=Citrus sinensis TaxID=2711 RepID=A0ACB8KL55_CITSI|nr:Long chain acyl-CoA synthetase 7 (peroxisomal) [Citrus sinensis]
MEDSSAQRRFKAVQRHLTSTNTDRCSQLDYNHTTGCFVQSQGYSVRLPEKLQTGKWNVYRSARSPLTLVDRFPDHPEIGTLHDNFIYAVENYPDYKYLGTRVRVDGTVGGYKWMTYGEVSAARKEIGSGLLFHGLQKGVRIGLYLINRPEWLIVDHACSAYSYISVPLYDTLGPDAVKYVVNHAEIEAIFCIPQTLNTYILLCFYLGLVPKKCGTLLSFISEIPSVHLIVVVGGKDEHLPSLPSTSGVKLISYLQLQSQGVVLTHGNLISNVAGFSLMVQFYPSDIYMSYLPLAHIYERANQIVSVYYGVAVGFYQGDNLKLMDDLAVLKPTIFPSVPRLYNRIYSGITNAVKASGTLREKLFTAAYNSKKQAIVSGQTPSKMWDRLVFNKIRERLGGRVRFMGSGASPLSPDVMDFLKVCFGCQVMEGYGMTETSCIISAIDKGDNLSGHVGSPNPACEIKLVDVPEMNYTSEDQPHPRGEICVRGPIVFQGYYKNEVQTREVIDGDGWLHTGDIGLWLPGGRLKIIDRKKNIFKLAQGEYVAPEKIENVYAKCKFVLQCFIYGDSFNSCLVAIVAVDPDVLKDWAASQGIKFEDLEQLCNDLRARAAVLAEMNAVGEEGQLRGFEYAKAVTLMPEPFSVENGLLTPTFKIKRPQAKERFAKAISNMYAELATSDQIPQKTSNL